MKLKNFNSIIENTSDETKEEIKFSMDVVHRIHELLDFKFQGKQKLLADKLGKSEAEVSKWLQGVHNFTLKTIFKMQAAFGEPIISVCGSKSNLSFTKGASSLEKGLYLAPSEFNKVPLYMNLEASSTPVINMVNAQAQLTN